MAEVNVTYSTCENIVWDGLSHYHNPYKITRKSSFILLQWHRKLKRSYRCLHEGPDVGVIWSFVVAETRDCRENPHADARELNLAHSGGKWEKCLCAIQVPSIKYTVKPLYTDNRYNDKICYNNLNGRNL